MQCRGFCHCRCGSAGRLCVGKAGHSAPVGQQCGRSDWQVAAGRDTRRGYQRGSGHKCPGIAAVLPVRAWPQNEHLASPIIRLAECQRTKMAYTLVPAVVLVHATEATTKWCMLPNTPAAIHSNLTSLQRSNPGDAAAAAQRTARLPHLQSGLQRLGPQAQRDCVHAQGHQNSPVGA